jgi:hypothetical protein
MRNSQTMERQNAVKSVSQIFQGAGPLDEEEEKQFKRLVREAAHFNKVGKFEKGENQE